MKRILIVTFFLFLAACSNSTPPPTAVTDTPLPPTATTSTVPSEDAPYLPNPAWQPGAYNPDVTQDTIQNTICVSGYTKTIRPPASYTDALKVQQIAQYGYSDTNTADYEEDHLIALEIGGAPKDPKNLWPQPRNTQPYNAAVKDTLEFTLYRMVCAGNITLAEAQNAIVTDWVQAYHKYVLATITLVTPQPTEP